MKESTKKYLKNVAISAVSGPALLIINLIIVYIIFGENVYYNEILQISSIKELVFRCIILSISSALTNISFLDLRESEKKRDLSMKERVCVVIRCVIILCIGTFLPFIIKSAAFLVVYVVMYAIIVFIGGCIDIINKFILEKPINKKINELNKK